MASVGVGVDVSKDSVEVAIEGVSEVRGFKSTKRGLASLVRWLGSVEVHRVVVEATGGYEHPVLEALFKAGLPVVQVQPLRARAYARATGHLAKTDALDARVLAGMASGFIDDLRLWQPASPEMAELRDLVTRRQQLVGMRDDERRRLKQSRRPTAKSIRHIIKLLDREASRLEQAIEALVQAHMDLKRRVEALTRVDGVGLITAVNVLAVMPELGTMNRRQVAALAGVAPINRDSGQKRGQRYIQGGRKSVRRALYMAALVGSQRNEHLRVVYQRLLQQGKPKKVALVAVMRRLLIHLNSLMKRVLALPTAAAA